LKGADPLLLHVPDPQKATSLQSSEVPEGAVTGPARGNAAELGEALPWFTSLAETSIDGLIYLAPAESRQAEISERVGDRLGAIAHYRRFLELWRDADPELAPWVTYARSRLQALEGKGGT
jgi:hypothetical protein